MYYFIQHENSNRPFLFQSDDQYAIGDTVICDTHRGEVKGTVVEYFIAHHEQLAKVIAKACHAYWPLAQIIRKYEKPIVTSIDEVPQEIVDQTRRQEVAKIIGKLGFDRCDW